MTDLEMTRLCAEAMGCKIFDNKKLFLTQDEIGSLHVALPRSLGLPAVYDPLRDDAQAMELVKEWTLDISYLSGSHKWSVTCLGWKDAIGKDYNLNRAIVSCVAQAQAERANNVSVGTDSR
jgi:hypothetical protein